MKITEKLKEIIKNFSTKEEKPKGTIYDQLNNELHELSFYEKTSLLNKSIQKTPEDLKAIEIKNNKNIAMDSISDSSISNVKNNKFGAMNPNAPDIIYSHFALQGFIGYTACAILKQNWIINAACTVPAEDAIRSGWKLSIKDDEETIDPQMIDNIQLESINKFHMDEICKNLEINKRVFGISVAIPIFRGDYDYSVPFNIDSVQPNSYMGWKVIEPMWLTPELDYESASNPSSPYFYIPTWWRLSNGTRVHRSHCIVLINSEVPDVLKPTYYYGGIPLTQLIYQRVYASEKVANEAPLLALTKRLLVMDANLENFIGNQKEAEKTLSSISWLRDNFGVAIKRPGDQVNQIDTSLMDFDALIMTQYQLVAAIAQMPATKLLKTSPKGFNATGEFELKDYIQTLQSIQENDFKKLIDRHNSLYTKSYMGKELKIKVEFKPIDMPTGAEKAQINSMIAQNLSTLIMSNVISPEEARENLKFDESSGFSTLDLSTSPSKEQEQQEMEKMMQQQALGLPTEQNGQMENNMNPELQDQNVNPGQQM